MMYAKLALRNVRRTARDYLIYVVTLVLSVGMFYGFFSLVSPYYNATLPVPIHLDVLKKMMRIAVPLVGLFVVFLMSYVNSYMLRRKQKETAVINKLIVKTFKTGRVPASKAPPCAKVNSMVDTTVAATTL